MIRRAGRAFVLAAFALTVGACGLVPRVGNDTLHIVNSSTIPVTLVVNDREVELVEPNTSLDVGPGMLPAMPWHVAARTSGGRDLVTLDVAPGSVHDEVNLDGTGSYSAPATRVDLSCGQVRIYVGRIMPSGPFPGPGVPGDCDP